MLPNNDISDKNIEDAYPLSPLQQGMLFHSISAPGSGVYLEQLATTIANKGFSLDAFKQSWRRILARHNAFRSAFVWQDLKQPLQVVRKELELPWQIFDWRDHDTATRQSMLAEFKHNDQHADFTLNHAPLMRMALVCVDNDSWIWIWTRHHLIADGWSTNHVLGELKQIYASELAGEEPSLPKPVNYRQYIGWLQQRDKAAQKSFWQDYLAGVTQRTVLTIEKHRQGAQQLGEYGELAIALPATSFQSLQTHCKHARVTLNTAVQTAWGLLLSRYSNCEDVVWGATVSGRPPALPGVNEAVGLFINTIPQRANIRWHDSVHQLMQSLQQSQLASMAFQETALADIVKWSDYEDGGTLFDSVVVYENYPTQALESSGANSGLAIGDIEYKEKSNLPLALIVLPRKTLEFILIYDKSVFAAKQIQRMLDQLVCLVTSMSRGFDVPLKALDFLPGKEQQTLLKAWNTTHTEIDGEQCIDALILQQAKQSPKAVALVCGDQRIDYLELESRSTVYQQALIQRQVMPGHVVAICLPRGVDALIWMLAALRTGAAYLLLDQEYPDARLVAMLTHSGATRLVTDNATVERFSSVTCPVLLATECESDVEHPPPSHPDRRPSDNAYLLYTSGSSGAPKGVMITHRNLVHSTLAREEFYHNPPTAFLLLSSLSFDSSVAGIFWTLVSGGKLVISMPKQEQNMDSLLDTIEREQVTHTLCLPSLYGAMLDHAEHHQQPSRLGSMEVVINAGEPMPCGAFLKQHHRVLPNTRIVNEYGPTEATVWCSAYDATAHNPALSVPIGKPIANTQMFVMDKQHDLAPLGAAGELVIGGAGLSPGYWENPGMTHQRFRHHPCLDDGRLRVYHSGDLVRYTEDGNLIYLGRIDEQIKLRGYRIEPDEIEARIGAYPGISAAKVMAHPIGDPQDGNRQKSLTAFVVFDQDSKDIAALNDYLREHLPAHQLPGSIIAIAALPTLANGKIDSRSLAALIPQRATPTRQRDLDGPPLDAKQKCLVKIWKSVLGLKEISIHDNFFHLGGDSIASIRIVSSALQAGYRLGPNDLFDAPTIAALSRRLVPVETDTDTLHTPSSQQLARLRQAYGNNAINAYPLTDNQSAFLFAHLSDAKADPGHMQIQAWLDGDLDVNLFGECCKEIMQRHDALRSAISWRDRAEPEQVVYDSCAVDMAHYPLNNHGDANSTPITSYLQQQKLQGVQIDHAPTWKLGIFQTAPYTHRLCFSFHHGLVDGWSASITVQQIIALYQARIRHQRLSIDVPGQFHAYIRWLADADTHAAKQFWLERLSATASDCTDNTVLPKKSGDRTLASLQFRIADQAFTQLQSQLRRHQITPTQLIHAAWSTCLSAANGGGNIGFYTTVSGREVPVSGIDKIVGQLTNHIPVILSGLQDCTFSQVIALAAEFMGAARPHSHISPAQLQNWHGKQIGIIATVQGMPFLLQSLVLMENFPWSPNPHVDHPRSIQLSGLQQRGQNSSVSQANVTEANITASFPLTLVGIPESQQLTVQLHIDAALFDADRCHDLLQQIKRLLVDWSVDDTMVIPEELDLASRAFFQINTSSLEPPTVSAQPHRAYSALEKSLLAIWRDILKLPIEDIQQSFFGLGGNSLTALRMAEHIENLLQLKMPLAMLIQHDSIEKLAAALQANASHRWQTVVPIQPKGEKRPVFGIHAEGNILFYRDLSQTIGNDRPFYGLQSPELDDGGQQFASIEEMAASYVKEIQTIEPTGPYNLCGMCFGGWVAFEMAQQITKAGGQVNALIVLDSEGPPLRKGIAPTSGNSSSTAVSTLTYSRKAPLLIKIFKHLSTGRFLEVAKTYIAATPFVYRLLKAVRPKKEAESAGARIKKVRLNQEYLQRRYDTDEYTGKVSFIRSEEFEGCEDRKYEIPRWKEICDGRVDTYLTPGSHLNLLEPPYVYKVAEIVERILDDPPKEENSDGA